MQRFAFLFISVFAALIGTAGVARAQLTEVTTVTNRVTVQPSTTSAWTDASVRCPAGLVALSGGADTPDFNYFELSTSAPTFDGSGLAFQPVGNRVAANGWYVSVRNLDTKVHTVTAVAMCAPLNNVIVAIASINAPAGSTTSPSTGGTSAVCPSGYSATGGGIDVAFPGTMRVSTLGPVFGAQYLIDVPAGQQAAPTGWNGNVRNEGNAGTVKVAAVCAPLTGMFSIVTAPFTTTAGTVSGQSARCPANTIALGGGVDSNELTRNVLVVSTPLFPANPQFPSDRDAGSYTSANGWYSILYTYGPANFTARVAAICATPNPGIVVAYEFYNTNLRHYFRTSSAAEAAGVDRGSAGAGWVRTGDNFFAYVAGSGSPGSDVCRFYTFGANSHFYTAFADECAGLKSPNSGWVYEGLSFRIPLPSSNGCTVAGTVPVYRLYNNRFAFTDSNHRFTTQAANVATLQQQGWTYEGIAFCAPVF